MAMMNEKWAALSFVSPRKRPALRVTPEREAPGISASICAQPIKKAFLRVSVAECDFPFDAFVFSARSNTMPKKMVAYAMISGVRR